MKLDLLLPAKVEYINSYLQVLSKAFMLVNQRLDHRSVTEDNVYDNTELMCCYVDAYASCLTILDSDQLVFNSSKLNQSLALVLSDVLLSGLGTWLELNDIADTIIYIIFYKAFNTLKNRNQLIFLLGLSASLCRSGDKNLFGLAHRTLVSPFNFKKTENRFKEADKKEKKVPIVKLPTVERFYADIVGRDNSLLSYLLSLTLEKNSFTLFELVESVFRGLLGYFCLLFPFL